MKNILKDRDWLIIFMLLVTCLSLLAAIDGWVSNYVTEGRIQRSVYATCEASRLVTDGALEEACGTAQDASDTEFLCNANNQDPDTNCWVELK